MKNKNEKGQIIALTGVILTGIVVVMAVISADLANIGVGTLQVHSKALIPEFTNIRSRFEEVLSDNINKYKDIEYSFNKTYRDFYLLEIKHGNFFNATLNNYTCTVGTITADDVLYTANVFFVNVSLSLDDSVTCISEDNVVFTFIYTGRV